MGRAQPPPPPPPPPPSSCAACSAAASVQHPAQLVLARRCVHNCSASRRHARQHPCGASVREPCTTAVPARSRAGQWPSRTPAFCGTRWQLTGGGWRIHCSCARAASRHRVRGERGCLRACAEISCSCARGVTDPPERESAESASPVAWGLGASSPVPRRRLLQARRRRAGAHESVHRRAARDRRVNAS